MVGCCQRCHREVARLAGLLIIVAPAGEAGRRRAGPSYQWRGRCAAAILAGMTNPLEWIAASSSHHGGSSDPGGLTLTTAAAWGTVIAAIVAIVALGIASYTIWSSNRALIRERQLTFELGVLAQLAHACAHLFTDGEQNEALALTRLLPGELEDLRRDIEERATNGTAFSPNAGVLSDHWDEYDQAVSRRLGRSPIPKRARLPVLDQKQRARTGDNRGPGRASPPA